MRCTDCLPLRGRLGDLCSDGRDQPAAAAPALTERVIDIAGTVGAASEDVQIRGKLLLVSFQGGSIFPPGHIYPPTPIRGQLLTLATRLDNLTAIGVSTGQSYTVPFVLNALTVAVPPNPARRVPPAPTPSRP